MPITPLPTPPSRAVPATFSTLADAFLSALPTFQSEANALGAEVSATASEVAANTAIATAAANDAVAVASAVKWVSGTTYAQGVTVWSPTNVLTYRRKIAGAGTTDPSGDGANWVSIGLPSQTGNAGKFVTTDGESASWVDIPPVYVSGTLSLYAAQSTTLTITNYDSATTYSVEATAGTATITGDTITYTAGATAGSVTMTITAGAATRDLTITVNAEFNSYIATPAATPAAFGGAFEGGFYTGMIWNELVESATSFLIGTGSKAFTVPDMASTPIVYSGQSLEIRSRANPANKMIGTVTGALGTTLTINVTSVGGSGTFTDWSIMAKYRVIVAPKSSGESSSKMYKVDNTAAPTACQTLSEGRKATLAMVAAGNATMYPAAWFCKNLNIGAKTDWYLPARDELELCWRNLKPTADSNYVTADRPSSAISYTNLGSLGDTVITHGTNNNSSPTGAAYIAGTPAQVAAGKNFRTGESEAFAYGSYHYWSASEYSSTAAWAQYWRSESPGSQHISNKTGGLYVRAVRRSII